MFIKWASFKKIRTQIECYCVVFLCQNNSVLFFIFCFFYLWSQISDQSIKIYCRTFAWCDDMF